MYDLRLTALTPGRPDVLAAAYVTATAAGKLIERLRAHGLSTDERIVPHEDGITVDNVNERNAAHLEVLLAVLERREAAAVLDRKVP
jgi:hypothetical protein